ncbi:MAG: YaiI/YqxD family protein [Anaerolineae bacterium]|nr:YaiI/YqxD family protein [Anaerolineae bacterium]
MLDIYVDADGCPVKDEIYRVAARYDLDVILVANAWMRVPERDSIGLIVVDQAFDAADDWIVEHATENDIVITDDIPLAARCLKTGAQALSPRGRVFTGSNIGSALATRDFLAHLRELGTMGGGPAPFAKQDRSQFLQRLDEIIQTIKRL